ncbi:hypothetical protein [Paraburkholderia humisilvae]|uniref:hypothetical protein n=1 Tax=Paraburkholderia humisilvae TaxID=627669 RepID=UPI001C2EA3A4|nr:hypothetical protein [Paraburkholderia humisilvae]
MGYQDDLNWYAYVGNNPVNLTDPGGLIASASGNFASSSAAAPATAPKLDTPAFSMPAAATSSGAIQVAARNVKSTGNPPGVPIFNPNGLDVDYIDSAGNLSAQYHESHGEAHGHNFWDGKRDPAHLPMSPIPYR